METMTRGFDEFDVILPPIAGGDDEIEGGEVATETEPAGDDPGGGDAVEEGTEEGPEGDETQPEGDEGQEGQEGEPGGEPGGEASGRVQQAVPYSRFKEVNDLVRELRQQNQLLISRWPGGQGNGQPNGGQPAIPEMPKEYVELDKGMAGYMRHYLDPIATHIIEQRNVITELRDESRFYRGPGRTLNERQSDLVERTRDALSQKLRQPVERADALLFLRGHPQYGREFVDQQAAQSRALQNSVTAARRQAGKVGARGAVSRGRGESETVDLNKMSRPERIRYFERVAGNTPV